MYISKLEISGIRGFTGPRQVQLDFARPDGTYAGWTVLAGRNGSGKSTLLQAIALCLVGPYFIQDLESWGGTRDGEAAVIRVTVVQNPEFDDGLDFGSLTLELRWDENDPYASQRWAGASGRSGSPKKPRFRPGEGWFFAGYGPFRRLSPAALGHGEHPRHALYAGLRTLFDQDASLVEGVSWLIEQHLYQLEGRPGADELLNTALSVLGDGLLPDGYSVSRVDSDGLWLRKDAEEFPLRQMSEGYRTVTALVVDMIRQMHIAYGRLEITHENGVPTLRYPGVVVIDEIENHLHLTWQKRIGDWLTSHFPLVQFIVTTHSPYICQAADPNGLIALPGPDEARAPRILEQDLYERVVFGSADDAILTELFGAESLYSADAEEIRRQLGELEERVLSGDATEEEIAQYKKLSQMLSSSLTARVDEISSRLGRQE